MGGIETTKRVSHHPDRKGRDAVTVDLVSSRSLILRGTTVREHRSSHYTPNALYPFEITTLTEPLPSSRTKKPITITRGIRIFNANETSGRIYATIDNKILPTALVYGSTSFYQTFALGTHTIKLAHNNTTIANTQITLTSEHPAITLVYSIDGLAVYNTTPTTTANGANVRIIHAQPHAGTLKLNTENHTPIAADLAPHNATPYVTIPTIETTTCMGIVHINIIRNTTTIKRSVLTLDQGYAYTAIIIHPRTTPRDRVKLVLLRDTS